MTIAYREFVDKKHIGIDLQNYGEVVFRRKLVIPLKTYKTNKSLIFIMMNPSKADNKKSDTTIDKISKYANSVGYKEVIILNTISLCNSKSTKVISALAQIDPEIVQKEDERNQQTLTRELLNPNTDICLATGNALAKHGIKSIKFIYNKLQGKKVYAFKSVRNDSTKGRKSTVKGFTFHPSRQNDNFLTIENRFCFTIAHNICNKKNRILDIEKE